MKKILSIVLILTFMLTVPLHAAAAYTNGLSSSKVPILKLATAAASTDVKAAAAEYLEIFRSNDDYEMLGFTAEQFYGMRIGNPFLVYQFDTEGRNLTADIDTVVYTCPMVYGGKIIGVIAAYYNEETEQYSFAAYRDTMYENLSSGTVDTSKNLIVGNMDSTLFVTDGTNVDILGVTGEKKTNVVSRGYIENMSSAIKAAGNNFVAANDVSQSPLPQVQLNAASAQTRDDTPIILGVDTVLQGNGNCVCAAWAAVLNFRFDENYTAITLGEELEDEGFDEDVMEGVRLTQIQNFTNWKYAAGCVYYSTPPSFTTIKNAILAMRPITGLWWSYPTNEYQEGQANYEDKIFHAINIIGYRQLTASYYNYYVVNPWIDHIAMLHVTDSSNVICDDGVVLPDANRTNVWHLDEAVY